MFGWLDKFLNLRSIARANREENQPRAWLLVDAYGPSQSRPRGLMNYKEALRFLKENIGLPFVEADIPRGILFYDGRKRDRQT